jgi:DNA-binding LacI/PurR family transcriptional regulator
MQKRSFEAMATLKDVAKECGLSLPTVSQVFGSRSRLFSEETRQRVFESAKRLGYRRHTGATNLATGRTNTVFVAIQGMGSLATSSKIDSFIGFTEGASQGGQQISLACFSKQNMYEDPAFKRLLNERICDSVIFNVVMKAQEMDELEALFGKVGIPIVWLNVERPFNAVSPDEAKAAELLARRFLENGHKSIFYIGVSNASHFSTERRPELLRERFLRLGGEKFESFNNWRDPEHFRKRMGSFFKKPGSASALALYSDGNLLSLAKIAEEAGASLHRTPFAIFDCSTGYSPHSVRTRLDGAAPNFRLIGSQAVSMAVRRVERGGGSLPSELVPPVDFHGETLRPAAKG